ncbi:MAG: hypothetical protein H0X43_01720 [Nitrosospira sp.]|nr:hypothetical protein [Nitrosospira sp.]
MRQFTVNQLIELLTDQEAPCVSLYQPTHRHHPDNQQDPIRYRNLLREIETSLSKTYPAQDVRALLERFEPLATDDRFWNCRTDGLAILSTRTRFQVFDLQRPVPELVVVADSFHLKPLLRITQSADRYQILCLSRETAKLYEGNRDVLDPVELTEMPSTITEALGEELTEPHQTVASYGKGAGSRPRVPHGEPAMHHGHGGKKDEVDIDAERFFRVIDRGILEHHSRPSGLPLMLAALAEYHGEFRQISHNPYLMAEGLDVNPDALDLDQLRAEAWRKVEPLYLERLAKLVNDYAVAKARQLGSDDLLQVAAAAMAGRVGTLLVEANRELPGRIRPETGEIQFGDLAEPDTDDVLDDLAEMTLRANGEVVIVPSERMPTTTGAAAIYRY